MSTYLLCIPTYNESENILDLLVRLGAQAIPNLSILVIDDGSPDGTADLVGGHSNQISILRRSRKEGLGPAYKAGFAWGLARDFDFLIEMDADGSHQPEELSRLIQAAHSADLVLGTRWMPGGAVENWPAYRKAISRIGTWYAEWGLKLPYKDLTGGFRVLTRDLLQKIDYDSIESIGYGFQIEIVMRAHDAGLRITEVPITFIERTKGRSKMSKAIVFEALQKTTRWAISRRLYRR
jgi:dolichol-phosphate mannosyltransferase